MDTDRDIRFLIELHLKTGTVVTYHVRDDRVREIVARPDWDWPAGIPEDAKPFAGVFSDLAQRVSKGTGFVQASHRDGRTWLIRADQIAAFAISDYREPERRAPTGFELPIASRSEGHVRPGV